MPPTVLRPWIQCVHSRWTMRCHTLVLHRPVYFVSRSNLVCSIFVSSHKLFPFHYLFSAFFTLHIPKHLTNLIFMRQIWCVVKNYSKIFFFHVLNIFPARTWINSFCVWGDSYKTWILHRIVLHQEQHALPMFPLAMVSSSKLRCPHSAKFRFANNRIASSNIIGISFHLFSSLHAIVSSASSNVAP